MGFGEQMNREKLMKMASAVRTGGKGSVRRLILFRLFFFLPYFGSHGCCGMV
jgi:hypothetical protein